MGNWSSYKIVLFVGVLPVKGRLVLFQIRSLLCISVGKEIGNNQRGPEPNLQEERELM